MMELQLQLQLTQRQNTCKYSSQAHKKDLGGTSKSIVGIGGSDGSSYAYSSLQVVGTAHAKSPDGVLDSRLGISFAFHFFQRSSRLLLEPSRPCNKKGDISITDHKPFT